MNQHGYGAQVVFPSLSPAHYQGWDGALAACEYDAKDMRAIAQSRGFARNRLLLTADATAANVIAGITEAARGCRAGDLFLLTYSGHGGQVPDTNHDERRLPTRLRDNYDETWVALRPPVD